MSGEEFEGEYDEEFEGDESFDCSMDRDGYCGAAGSEECEFECPYRAEQIRAEMRKRKKEGRA